MGFISIQYRGKIRLALNLDKVSRQTTKHLGDTVKDANAVSNPDVDVFDHLEEGVGFVPEDVF